MLSDSHHTPGPWVYDREFHSRNVLRSVHGGFEIGFIDESFNPPIVQLANRRLIALAPAMFDKLVSLGIDPYSLEAPR